MPDAFQRTQLRRYEKSIGEFKQLHHKIDWKTVKWIDSWYHPQRLNYLLSLRFWSFFTEYKIEASFSYSLLCYIYTNRTCLIFLSSLLILPSYSCSSLYICFKLWLKLNGISRKKFSMSMNYSFLQILASLLLYSAFKMISKLNMDLWA